ncbi:hypothetical protein LOD99_6634 [Oopsacas minuta]|uniref:MACPF domain-containing protein n=1 Tax=Oopsacas minuta TaxID=111878 RepID=A0AAV7JMK1_9METZ|nr:hypothetical protein LOD99_6634 [Oopsacas minuta]
MIWEEEEGTLKLGFSTNLLDGYKPNIYFHQIEESPLKPSKQPALYESDIQVRNPDIKAKWSGLTISLHATTEELVTAITKVRIRSELFEDHKSEGGGIAIWPTGALVLEGISKEARKQALSKMSEQIGLDLTKEDQSYAVVRMVRILGDSLHPYYETGEYRNIERDDCLTPEALQAIRKLQKLHRQEPYVNLEGARGYVQFYNTFGTHFISSVEVGESIFQVFSYGKEAFRYLNKVYEENPLLLNEPFSTSFSQYTVARHAPYGYTSGISKICITSQDNKLSESIEAGKWYDSKYALTNSIFTPRLKPGTIDFNKMFRKNTAIEVKLTSINVFAEYYRKLIWRRVLKGALYCLYWKSPNVEPFFSNECPYDLNEIYKDSDIVGGDGLVSNIATPTVSFCKEIIDLGSIHVNFANLINVWSEFSNALQIPQSIPEDRQVTIEVPGSSLVTIVSYIISIPNGGKYTVNLSLSEPAFKEMKSNFVCGEFYGGLLVTNPNATKSFVVMNGLLYEIVEGRVEIVSDIRTSPPSRILVEHLIDLQFSLISAEARLGYLFSKNALSPVEDQSLNVMRNFLLWLGREASTTVEEDGSIAALKARALYLAKLANGNQGPGLPIPYLKYDAYRDTINSVQNLLTTVTANIRDFQNQIRARKEEERRLESEKTINENIIKSGQLIEGYIRAQEEYQRSMSQLYTTEYNEKKELCDKLKEKAGNSQYMLDKQRIEVNVQVVEYKEAVKRWQEEQTIRACLNIAANIFSLGFTFTTPLSSIKVLESLGTKTQKLQKAVNVFNALIKTYDAFDKFPSSPQHVVDALSQDLSNMEMTSLEWDEMKVEMDACLNTGPPVSEKISLSAAFAILVLRGKALLQVQNQLQTQLSELSALSSRTRISEEQVKRLEKLHLKLQAKPEELDVQAIDLVGLTGQLYLFQRQMLMTMASTIVIQDRALQYEYLRPPTPICSFSMINLQLAILTQAQSINVGIQVQPSPELHETPIIYEIHGVKPSDLTDHNSYEFVIPLSAREFSAYNYVRVWKLRWDVGGISPKVNGKYYSELNFGGRPFFDRGFNGNPLEFQTLPRMYTILNNVENRPEILDPNSEGPIHRSGAMLNGKEKKMPINRGRRHPGVENVTGTENIEDIEPTQIVSYSSHYYDESKEHDPELNPLESIVIDSIPYKEDPFKGMISDITPFSTWKISLPPVKDNEGLQFDNSLTIRLKFYIYAQLLERAITPLERIQRAISLRYGGSSATFMSDSQSDYSIPNVKSGDVSIPDVLKMMSDSSVCAGTDVVFSLDEAQINKNFEIQYQNRKDNPEFFRSTGLYEGSIVTTDTK